MPEKDRFDHEVEIIEPGPYGESVPSRFDRMVLGSEGVGDLIKMLKAGCTLLAQGEGSLVNFYLRGPWEHNGEKNHLFAKGKFRTIYPGLLGISECFKDGWDLVAEAYEGIAFEVDGSARTIDDDDEDTSLDKFLKTVPSGTLSLEFDLGECFACALIETRGSKQERRGGRVLTYAQTVIRRSRSKDIFEAIQLVTQATETVHSDLRMDSPSK